MDFTFNHVPLPTPDEEVDLARDVEAGLLASALLRGEVTTTVHVSSVELVMLAERGRLAWQRLWTANLRLVVMLASREARRGYVCFDDLVQEGSIALADALMRWDHARGRRMSTLAWAWVEGRLRTASRDVRHRWALTRPTPETGWDLADDTRSDEVVERFVPGWLATVGGRSEQQYFRSVAAGVPDNAASLASAWGTSRSTAARIRDRARTKARTEWDGRVAA